MSLDSYLRAAPKAELHVHLEGSIQPETLLTLARRNKVDLPADNLSALRQWFAFRDFNHFIEVYMAITACLRDREDYEIIAYEFGAAMARQNIRYAEVTFTPATHYFRQGVGFDVCFDGLTRGRARAKRDFGVDIVWVFDISRHATTAGQRAAVSDYTLGVAMEGRRDGVVAFGLGGREVDNPPELFASWFERARAEGLRSVPHAGETVGPASIWGAIHALGADRIGHGVRAIEDPALMEYLATQRIPLEVNPTSNVCLGVYPTLTAHPLRRLHEAGILLTVNSDDPPLFNTSLNDEIVALAHSFSLDIATIDELLLNGIRHSFLPDDRKQALEAEFRAEMTSLKSIHVLEEPDV